ncbi:MAG: ProQ/FinO family protein [Burkholderiales bacterium]|nr:ProQ/FinO family protein [Burkholderiales bacterium]
MPMTEPSNALPEPVPEPVPTLEGAVSTAEPLTSTTAAPGPRDLSPAECARELKARFPALFGDSPKPIKLRIQADIQERAQGVFSKKALSIFLHRHTGSTSYLVALSKAKSRFDLDGQPAGELSDEHRQLAGEELKRRRAVHEERRALEEAQWLNRAHLLRDFEATTLTRANFCALKGVADEELDGLLEIARGEKKEYEARRPGPDQARREGPRPPQGDRRPPSRERRPAPTGDEARKPR